MALIHHVTTGAGGPPMVFVHGFGCAHDDWDAQVAHFAPRRMTVAVDLRGHGASPGPAADCSIERYGADVAEVMRALALPPAIVVGHSMGCRVAVEAALQAPERTKAVVLVDGSQFAPAMGPVLRQVFAQPDGFASLVKGMFRDMSTPKSPPAAVAKIEDRVLRLPRAVGEKMLLDMQRYDVTRYEASLGALRVPVLALQTTYSNEKRERRTMSQGQSSPYLDMLRARLADVRVDIIEDTGHFPQIDEPARTNAVLGAFAESLAG